MALAPPGYLLLGNIFGPDHLGDKLFGLGLGRFPEFCPLVPLATLLLDGLEHVRPKLLRPYFPTQRFAVSHLTAGNHGLSLLP